MPPTTDEEQTAEAALDSKLSSFFAEETKDVPPPEPADTEEIEDAAAIEGVEPEAEADTEPDEPAEEPADDRLRDEAGRYLPKFTDPDIKAYLDKYNGDVGQALRAANDAQKIIGRQSAEVEEARRIRQWYEQQQQAQRPQAPLYENFEEMVAEAPDQAMELAWQRQDRAAYEYAKREWEEAFPGGPRMWERMKTLEQQQAQQAQQVQAQTAPLAEQHEQQQWMQAVRQFASEEPEFMNVSDDDLLAAATRNPYWAGILQNTTEPVPARTAALRTLYLDAQHARGRQADTRAQATAEQRQASRQAKQQAAVASATTAREVRPSKGVDAFKDEFRKVLFDDSLSISSGLTRD